VSHAVTEKFPAVAFACTVPDVDLPKAAKEMGMIQKHFGKQHVLTREAATPPAYLNSQPEQFSYFHFVAHGTASRQSPLDSGDRFQDTSKFSSEHISVL
jgi:CHAT domain-containing protein